LCEYYKRKGKQMIAYLIGELFCGTLSDESPLEPQLNVLHHKARTLTSLSSLLDNSLIVVAIIILLPILYATFR
ncbi:hypothetical protein OBBRIDRAFT_694325, partial [Obba rivulosa]